MSLLTWLQDRLNMRSPQPSPAGSSDPPTILAQWLNGEIPSEPVEGAEARVVVLEMRYGIRIPHDFRRYLVEVAAHLDEPMEDDHLMSWQALYGVRSLPEELAAVNNGLSPLEPSSNPAIAAEEGSYLFFADYMVWCWGWAVCCSEGPNRGRVAFIGTPDGFVADSFSEFVERFLRDPVGMANTRPAAL